jgi:Flagellar hook-length control protein FliK
VTLTPVLPATTGSAGGPEQVLAQAGDSDGPDAGVFGAALAAAVGAVPPCRFRSTAGTAPGPTMGSFGSLPGGAAADGTAMGGGAASPALGEPMVESAAGSEGTDPAPAGAVVDVAPADLAVLAQLSGLPGLVPTRAITPAPPTVMTLSAPPAAVARAASPLDAFPSADLPMDTLSRPTARLTSPAATNASAPAAATTVGPHGVAASSAESAGTGPAPTVDVVALDAAPAAPSSAAVHAGGAATSPVLDSTRTTEARAELSPRTTTPGTTRVRSDQQRPTQARLAVPTTPGATEVGTSSPQLAAASTGPDAGTRAHAATDPSVTAALAAPTAAPAASSRSTATASEPTLAGAGAASTSVPDQVLRHLTSVRALREGGHRTVLRLEPEHLGAVTVTVDVRAGAVRMAVSGGAEALAAVREGLGHLRTSLASSGLDLGDVSLRTDVATATPASATSTSALSTSSGLDGRDAGAGPRPDAGAGGPGADQRPDREPRSTAAEPIDEASAPRRAPAAPAVTPATSDDDAKPGSRPRHLDVRI